MPGSAPPHCDGRWRGQRVYGFWLVQSCFPPTWLRATHAGGPQHFVWTRELLDPSGANVRRIQWAASILLRCGRGISWGDDDKQVSQPKTDTATVAGEFVVQGITGAPNVLFTVLRLVRVRLAGADRAEMVMVLRDHPAVAIGLVLLIINVCIHMRIGMHEIIQDYLDEEKHNRLANWANNAFAILVAVLTILAVAKISFWG